MKFAIEVDGTKQDNIPTTPKGAGKANYYEVTATCDEGIKAEWDYNAWNLKVDNITKGTKCTLAFNSTLSEDDYKEYIEAGVAYRRNTYRGKDITSKLTDGSLFKEIESGHFDDIFVGDYIVDNKSNQKDVNGNQIRYLIADIDNYLHIGQDGHELKTHHATIVPAVPLTTAKMNTTATTTGGYAGSEMVKTTLTTILNDYITPVFASNVITYNTLLSNNVDPALSNRYGPVKGASNSAIWFDRKLDLMSETCVFGNVLFSSSGFDPGVDTKQYAIFQLKPEFINSYLNSARFNFWLKDVVASDRFAASSKLGFSSNGSTSTFEQGVRPRFLIG